MDKKFDENNSYEYELRNLFVILIKKKWLFISVFCAIFFIGIIFSFIRPPQFTLESKIRISVINYSYAEIINRYFPVEAGELWIKYNEQKQIELISEEINSYEIINESLSHISEENNYNFKRGVFTINNRDELILKTVFTNKDLTVESNIKILNYYLEENYKKLDIARENLINKIDIEIARIEKEMNTISSQPDFKENIIGNKELDDLFSDYTSLKEAKNNLVDDKEMFNSRLEIIRPPIIENIEEYTNTFRDIIFSFFLAIALGLLVSYSVNCIQSFKRQKRKNN